MKKSLIALAALATVATAAQAQSSVTVYGIMDAGVRYNSDASSAGSNVAFLNGGASTSRIGFRGTEDLGGGKKANFVLESGLNPGTGASSQTVTLFDRTATVGLEDSKLGAINFGRSYNTGFYYAAAGITDVLGLAGDGFGANPAVLATDIPNWRVNQVIAVVSNTNLGTTRSDNNVSYASPVINGFQVRGSYSIGGQAGDSSKNNAYSYGASYTNGPVAIASAFFEAKDKNGINALSYTTTGGSYTIGPVKLVASYNTLKSDAGYIRTTTSGETGNLLTTSVATVPLCTSGGSGSECKTNVTHVGAKYQVTPQFDTSLAYYKGKFKKSGSADDGSDLKTVALWNNYALSKRTTVYLVLDNSKASSTIANTGNVDSNTAYTVGVKHTF
jgi:predicted porin